MSACHSVVELLRLRHYGAPRWRVSLWAEQLFAKLDDLHGEDARILWAILTGN